MRPLDSKAQIAVKVIMTLIFAWSGLFWSGVTVLQFYINDPLNSHLATGFLVGSLLLLLGLVLCWFRLYMIQFPVCVAGFIVYLMPTREMIDHVAGSGVIFRPTFEQRYLPMAGLMILSFALLTVRVWKIFSSKAKKKEEFNNSPSESILDKHSEE